MSPVAVVRLYTQNHLCSAATILRIVSGLTFHSAASCRKLLLAYSARICGQSSGKTLGRCCGGGVAAHGASTGYRPGSGSKARDRSPSLPSLACLVKTQGRQGQNTRGLDSLGCFPVPRYDLTLLAPRSHVWGLRRWRSSASRRCRATDPLFVRPPPESFGRW